jgi:hypothetical protein
LEALSGRIDRRRHRKSLSPAPESPAPEVAVAGTGVAGTGSRCRRHRSRRHRKSLPPERSHRSGVTRAEPPERSRWHRSQVNEAERRSYTNGVVFSGVISLHQRRGIVSLDCATGGAELLDIRRWNCSVAVVPPPVNSLLY